MSRKTYEFAELDKETFSLLAKLGFKPDVVFDVGAANGRWSDNIQTIFPSAKFHLFEPLISHDPQYKSNMDRNLQNFPNFTYHEFALGETDQDIPIHIFPNSVASSVLDVDDNVHGSKRVIVSMLTLETAIKTLNLPIPQVIKIDTQGNELAILKGAKNFLSKVDVLVLETWLIRGYGKSTPLLHELMNELLQYNFYLWDIADGYRPESGTLSSVDCFFINTGSNLAPQWHYAQ